MEFLLPVSYNFIRRPDRGLLFFCAAVFSSCFLLLLAFWAPALFGIIGAVAFAAAFVSSRSVRWMVFPSILVLDSFLLRNSGIPWQFGGLSVRPTDWIVLLMIGTVAIRHLLFGEKPWMRTKLDGTIGFFLGVTILSLFDAPNLRAGIVNWGHHVIYFLAFYAIVADWKDVPLEKIWKVFVFWTVLASISAVGQFFASGGGRALGFSGLILNHIVLPLFCLQLAALSLWGGAKRWIFAVFLLLTIVVTQTRGLWLGAGAVILIWLFSGYLLQRTRALPMAKRVTARFTKMVLSVFLMFLLLVPFLGQVEERAGQLESRTGTVYLRLFLWGLAAKLFFEHPVNGIGMGQFDRAVGQFPEMKNLAVFEWTQGLSAHNLLLTLLAEAGLFGGLALMLLLIAPVRLAWMSIKRARTPEELCLSWGFFLFFAHLVLAVFFAGTWEYYFTFFLALFVLFDRQLSQSFGEK
jgi:O-antigen ligase